MKKFFYFILAICLFCSAFFAGYWYGNGETPDKETVHHEADLLLIAHQDTIRWGEEFEISAIPYVGQLGFENIESSGPNVVIVSKWSKEFTTFRYKIPEDVNGSRLDSMRIKFETQVLLDSGLQTLKKQIQLKSMVAENGDSLVQLIMKHGE